MEGIGIGLNICKRIVESSGGTIEVFSAGKGKGSTFAFSMKMKLENINSLNDEVAAPGETTFGGNNLGNDQNSFVLDGPEEGLENHLGFLHDIREESKEDCDLNISGEYNELPSFAPMTDCPPDNSRQKKKQSGKLPVARRTDSSDKMPNHRR